MHIARERHSRKDIPGGGREGGGPLPNALRYAPRKLLTCSSLLGVFPQTEATAHQEEGHSITPLQDPSPNRGIDVLHVRDESVQELLRLSIVEGTDGMLDDQFAMRKVR